MEDKTSSIDYTWANSNAELHTRIDSMIVNYIHPQIGAIRYLRARDTIFLQNNKLLLILYFFSTWKEYV